MHERELATIERARSAVEATRLLRKSGPVLTNPAGETVSITDDWDAVLRLDLERAALVPIAVAAVQRPHEIWRLFTVDKGDDRTEHQPHLIWSQFEPGAEGEVVLAGTRRIDGLLHLYTWFRLAEPWALARRLWSRGTRVYPLLELQPLYVPTRDVLYLHPGPHVPYRAARIVEGASVFGYLDERLGFPSLVGLEIQDATRTVPELGRATEIAGVMSTSWQFGDGDLRSLAAFLDEFAEETAVTGRSDAT